jgi:hypothetical protein
LALARRIRRHRLALVVGALAAGLAIFAAGREQGSYRATALVAIQRFTPDEALLPAVGGPSATTVARNERALPFLPEGERSLATISAGVAHDLPSYRASQIERAVALGGPTGLNPTDVNRYQKLGLQLLAVQASARSPRAAATLADAFASGLTTYRRRLLARLIDRHLDAARTRLKAAVANRRGEATLRLARGHIADMLELRSMAVSSVRELRQAQPPPAAERPSRLRAALLAGLLVPLLALLLKLLFPLRTRERADRPIARGRPSPAASD